MHFKSKYVRTLKKEKCALEKTGNRIRPNSFITGKALSQNTRNTITKKDVVVERRSTRVVHKRIRMALNDPKKAEEQLKLSKRASEGKHIVSSDNLVLILKRLKIAVRTWLACS